MKDKILSLAKALYSDTSGIILPYVTLMLVAIVGIAVLALDGARYMSLQTQLQSAADALANPSIVADARRANPGVQVLEVGKRGGDRESSSQDEINAERRQGRRRDPNTNSKPSSRSLFRGET